MMMIPDPFDLTNHIWRISLIYESWVLDSLCWQPKYPFPSPAQTLCSKSAGRQDHIPREAHSRENCICQMPRLLWICLNTCVQFRTGWKPARGVVTWVISSSRGREPWTHSRTASRWVPHAEPRATEVLYKPGYRAWWWNPTTGMPLSR